MAQEPGRGCEATTVISMLRLSGKEGEDSNPYHHGENVFNVGVELLESYR